MIIAPSTLSADFRNLGQEVQALTAAGADWLHFDTMDGHFVESITYGPMILKAVRDLSPLPFDAHLMVTNPEAHLEQYIEAGADHILIQREVETRPVRLLSKIRALGAKAGLVLNPATPLDGIEAILPVADIVLVMSVEPGAGGQELLPSVLAKIEALRALIDQAGLPTLISVDGGINEHTVAQVAAAGVDVIVSGSWVFSHPGGYQEAIAQLRSIGDAHRRPSSAAPGCDPSPQSRGWR